MGLYGDGGMKEDAWEWKYGVAGVFRNEFISFMDTGSNPIHHTNNFYYRDRTTVLK